MTTQELAAIDDDDNRRGEPTEGLVPEMSILTHDDPEYAVWDEFPEEFYVDPYELDIPEFNPAPPWWKGLTRK